MEDDIRNTLRDSRRSTLTASMVHTPVQRHVPLGLAVRTVILSVLPVWISLLTNLLSTTVTIFFLSRADSRSETVAGIGLGITINNCLLRTFILGYNVGMITLVSQAMGRGEKGLVPELLNRALLSGTVALLGMGALLVFIGFALDWIGIDKGAARTCRIYTHITFFGFLFHSYYDAFRQYLNARGMFAIHFFVPAISLVINGVGCYLLITRAELGIEGAGISMDVQMFSNFLIIFTITMCYRPSRDSLRRFSRESFNNFWQIARLGLPSFLMMFLDLSALEVITFLSNYVSVDHLAANTVLINLFYVSIVFSYGV